MSQLNIPSLVKKVQEIEAEIPGFCDKAIAAITAAEGNTIGTFIIKHIGISDPKAAEDELISVLTTIKAVVAQGADFVQPFFNLLLNLQPATPKPAA